MFLELVGTFWGNLAVRFSLGVLGTICYFVIARTGFIQTEADNPNNPNLFKPVVIIFFALIGGLLPILFDVRNLLGCFVQGLTIRPTLTLLYMGARKS